MSRAHFPQLGGRAGAQSGARLRFRGRAAKVLAGSLGVVPRLSRSGAALTRLRSPSARAGIGGELPLTSTPLAGRGQSTLVGRTRLAPCTRQSAALSARADAD